LDSGSGRAAAAPASHPPSFWATSAPPTAAAAAGGAGSAAAPAPAAGDTLHEPFTAAIERQVRELREAGLLPSEAAVNDATRFVAYRLMRDDGDADGAGADGSTLMGDLRDAAGRALPTGDGEAEMGADAEIAVSRARDAVAGVGSAGAGAGAGAGGRDGSSREVVDRYKPRKPRFFNRVKTGYDWNRYNQSHYDHDNPPPKRVQGYKFAVFYPDLLDRTKTPTYTIEPADTDEHCIIRFHAGPPYQDIAFKIVNQEWETQPKHGFKCSFDRGVLNLWFNFKRFWYRK